MKKKNWILPVLVALVIVAASLSPVFSSNTPAVETKEDNSTCCQKMKECKGKKEGSGGVQLDNLSHQFMNILTVGY